MKINVAYACDDNYLPHTGISILSLLDHNQLIDELDIYLISVNISKVNITEIQNIVDRFNRKLIVIPFKELCPGLKLSALGRHIETVYAKLFFGNIADVDKIIYLDSDVIINGSLLEMWEVDLGENYFGLVKTVTKSYSQSLGLEITDVFYNDGVAIVNTSKLRSDYMQEKFINFIDLYNGNPPVLSEGTINVVCKNRIKTIHPKFNLGSSFLMYNSKDLNIISNEVEYYPNKVIEEALLKPVVIHYLTGWFKRPWEIGCTHPFKAKYLDYKAKTIWKDSKLVYKTLPLKLKSLKILSSFMSIRILTYIISFSKIFKKK